MSGSGETDWRGAPGAELDWAQGIPRSTRFDDTYFSAVDGISESRHVFLGGNRLPDRWRDRRRFTIAETGFGTGLNFLTCWQAWQQTRSERPAGACLHYLSVEGYPLSPQDLASAAAGWTELQTEAKALAEAYPPPLPGLHRLWFDDVCLDLVFGELSQALASLESLPELAVDAWFLDGFAPARNPGMWTPQLYRAMSVLGHPGSSFATFTAASDVRRGLMTAGFAVDKVAGFGRKRDMLRGSLETRPLAPAPPITPWHLPRHRYPDAAPAAIDSGRSRHGHGHRCRTGRGVYRRGAGPARHRGHLTGSG